MNRAYVLTPAAEQDVDEILDYIAMDSVPAALRVLADLRRGMEKVAAAPGIGHVRDDIANESLRIWAVHSYLIVYRSPRRRVEIVRVLHGARDIRALGL